ncbi:lipase (class 3) [Hypnocyclicus thermotrophus]|uniref:Lipase (Class 3) n=1 Tax=Hypnocyclicus thermotrophus TaxID=1627895 RepID=A0AA46E000_9FUSO|nr:hypothetical protein [Hypnocyclicus thermotrophus]TDT72275.1 lipase (class 3) [Hypnocyclicus thermotrophus]
MITDKEYLIFAGVSYSYFEKSDKGKTLRELFNTNKNRIMDSNSLFRKMDYLKNSELLNDYFEDVLDKFIILDVMDRTGYNKLVKNPTGFYAIAFQKIETKEVVISYRGSEVYPIREAYKDFLKTDLLIGIAKKPKQFDEGLLFYKLILDSVDYTKISITGHSLGGGIAQYVAVMSEEVLNDKEFVPETITFNAVGILAKGMIDVDHFFNYEKELKKNNFVRITFKKDLYKIIPLIKMLIINKNKYIKNGVVEKLVDKEEFDLNITKEDLNLISLTIKTFTFNKYTNKELEILFKFLLNKEIVYSFIKKSYEFFIKFSENLKYREKVKNYLHSDDFTSKYFPHIGISIEIDKEFKRVQNKIILDVIELMKRRSIIIEKNHMLDVFIPFIDKKTNNFHNNLEYDYIASFFRKIIFENGINNNEVLYLYFSRKDKLNEKEISLVKMKFVDYIKNSKNLRFQEKFLKELKNITNKDFIKLWNILIEKMSIPYKYKDIYDLIIFKKK